MDRPAQEAERKNAAGGKGVWGSGRLDEDAGKESWK
jgi:hypothetical protein